MEKLTYHKDKNFFMDWLMLNEMSTGEIALWHTLMNIGNRVGQKSIFNAPTSTVMKLTGLSKQGLTDARKKLIKRGFISYEKGGQNRAPIYEMIPLHKVFSNYFSFTKEEDRAENLTSDLTPNLTPHLAEDLPQELTIHKEQNTKKKRRGGSGGASSSLCKIYEENINKLTPLIQKELMRWIDDMGEDVVKEALIMTVKKGGKTFSYLEKILEQWQQAGLKTLDEVHTYELEKELGKTSKLIPFKKQPPKQKTAEESLDAWLKEEFQ